MPKLRQYQIKQLKIYGGFISAEQPGSGRIIKAIAMTAYTDEEAREKFNGEAIADFPPDNGWVNHSSGVVDVSPLMRSPDLLLMNVQKIKRDRLLKSGGSF